MPSAAEIRNRAAQELGILTLGQDLPANHATRITQGYAEVYAQLKEDGRATWAYSDDVPNEMAQHVVFLIAENCLGTYGVSESRYQRIMMGAQNARREIEKYSVSNYESQEEAVDY